MKKDCTHGISLKLRIWFSTSSIFE